MAARRWLFLTAPARAYKRGEQAGGRAPALYLALLVALPGGGFLLGGLAGALVGDRGRGAGIGVAVGTGLSIVWWLYVLTLAAVMRWRKQPLEPLTGPGLTRRHRRWWVR